MLLIFSKMDEIRSDIFSAKHSLENKKFKASHK